MQIQSKICIHLAFALAYDNSVILLKQTHYWHVQSQPLRAFMPHPNNAYTNYSNFEEKKERGKKEIRKRAHGYHQNILKQKPDKLLQFSNFLWKNGNENPFLL